MQDEYSIALFNVLIIKSLYVHGHYNEMVFLLPVALWLEAIRNEYLCKDSRLLLLRIAFKMYCKFIEGIDFIDSSMGIKAKDRGCWNAQYYYISSKIAMIQATMTLQHVNGQIRNACKSDDTFERIKSFIAKYNMGMNIVCEMQIDMHKKGRDFQGGVTLDPEIHALKIELSEDVDEDTMINSVLNRVEWHEQGNIQCFIHFAALH